MLNITKLKESQAKAKAKYYQNNKEKFRKWQFDRYHRTNPTTKEDVQKRIEELQKVLIVL